MGSWNDTVRGPDETFEQLVERFASARETQPRECSHCGYVTSHLANHSRAYGGNVGPHWLCRFCQNTRSASRLGAGGAADDAVTDMAAMLNELLAALAADS